MTELLAKHAQKFAVGGVGASAILFGMLQMQAGEIKTLREQNYLLVQRVTAVETRLDQRLGAPVPAEKVEIEAAKAEVRKEVKP